MMLAIDLALAAALLAIAAIDLRTHRIPDRISLPLIVAGLAWAGLAGEPWLPHLLGAAGGYAALAGFGAVFFRLRGYEGLGLGDAKLFSAAGAWLGLDALPPVLLLAAVGGLAFALLTGDARADRRVAFGPWIALGFWLVWIWMR